MFYALTPFESQTDRVHLFPSLEDAMAHALDGQPIFEVAVNFDASGRFLVPDGVAPEDVEPEWSTRAELHGNGSLTAQGTIPRELFVGRVRSPRLDPVEACLSRHFNIQV